MKFGIYGDYGFFTCGGYPGSYYYLEQDAQTFANWGVDYLKLDGCYVPNITSMEEGMIVNFCTLLKRKIDVLCKNLELKIMGVKQTTQKIVSN